MPLVKNGKLVTDAFVTVADDEPCRTRPPSSPPSGC